MKKILYIVVYFGELPQIFPCWMKSCEYNHTINWLLITDQDIHTVIPSNIKYIKKKFENFVSEVKLQFGENVCIAQPYRICDFRPLFGILFASEIKGYDYWGFCDVDMIFGDIRSFLSDEILNKYDRIGFSGHSTLIRNSPLMNNLFKKEKNLPEILSGKSKHHYFFDEQGLTGLCLEEGIKTFSEIIFADIDPYKDFFYLNFYGHDFVHKDKKKVFEWKNGQLKCFSSVNGTVENYDFMYVHFLRRTIYVKSYVPGKAFVIIPNMIISDGYDVNDAEWIESNQYIDKL